SPSGTSGLRPAPNTMLDTRPVSSGGKILMALVNQVSRFASPTYGKVRGGLLKLALAMEAAFGTGCSQMGRSFGFEPGRALTSKVSRRFSPSGTTSSDVASTALTL